MMNPPDRMCYEVVLHVNDSCTLATVISCKNVLDKTSSISSGALADHSGLSEISENCSGTPPSALPRISRSEDHLSVSTSSSSGLSVSQNQHKAPFRSVKPCLSKVKIICNCGKPGCDQTLPIKMTSSDPRTHGDHRSIAESADAGHHIETAFHSDMDLTDPLGRTSDGPETIITPPDLNDALDKQAIQSQDSFPKIKLPLRPSCLDLADSEKYDEEENEAPELWDLKKQVLRAICFPEKLTASERMPGIPSNYREDDNSLLFGMVWLILTEHARVRLEPPPCLTTRIFYDPSVTTDYSWPKQVVKCLKKMTEAQRGAIYEDFIRVRAIAFRQYPHLNPKVAHEDVQDELPQSPIVTYELVSDSENEYTDQEDEEHAPEQAEEHIEQSEADVVLNSSDTENPPRDSSTKPAPDSLPSVRSRKRADKSAVDRSRSESPAAKKARVDSPAAASNTAPTCADPGVLLVYARCDKWYYPGILKCTLDEWDGSVEPLMVHYYDGEEKELPPDQIFPMSRLPAGANIQRQSLGDDSVFEDVLFLSFTYSSGLRLPSALLKVKDIEDGTINEVTFGNTALSPKDVIRLRSALKTQFYPSRIRQNFTEVSQGAILFTASRRCRAQNTETKPQKPKAVKTTKPASSSTLEKVKPSAAVPSKPANVAKSTPTVVLQSATKKPSRPARPQPSVARKTATSSSEIDKRIKECTKYRCQEKSCLTLFNSSGAVITHQKKMARNRRRRHEGQALVFQCNVPDCSTISTSREQFRRHLYTHGQQIQVSTPPPEMSAKHNQMFAKPSGSGMTPGAMLRTPSDTDTDTSPSFRKYSRPSGQGLQNELVVLGETAKSFTGLKNAKKNEATSDIFDGLHFVLTKGMENQGQHSPKKPRYDSESDSTDFENYYHTNVKFDIAALQRVIEVGRGRVHETLTDVPQDALWGDSGDHSVIVVSNHPCTTPTYIHGVALGLTIIRHDTILECAKKGVPLRTMLMAGSAVLLSPGWDRQRNVWVTPRASKVAPLTNLTVMTSLTAHEFWHHLVRLLGGRAVEWLRFPVSESSGVFAILADLSIPADKRDQAKVRRLPVVTTEWLVQAVITGGKPPVYNYELPSSPSSS